MPTELRGGATVAGHVIWHMGNLNIKDIEDRLLTHTHAWDSITGRPSTFPPSSHSHAIADIVNLQATLDNLGVKEHTHADATTSASGFMSAADKSKLNGVATNANNYTHPSTHPPSIIAQDSSNRFVTDAEKSNWNGKETTSGAQAKATAAETNAKTYADGLTKVSIADTRNVNGLPSAYSTSGEGKKVHFEFKLCSAIGVTSTGTYCTLITDARWVGSSGGIKTQIALLDEGKILFRNGNSAETAWTSWQELETVGSAVSRHNGHANNSSIHVSTADRNAWNSKMSLDAQGHVPIEVNLAKKTGLADTGNYYASGNVEDALAEIGGWLAGANTSLADAANQLGTL